MSDGPVGRYFVTKGSADVMAFVVGGKFSPEAWNLFDVHGCYPLYQSILMFKTFSIDSTSFWRGSFTFLDRSYTV